MINASDRRQVVELITEAVDAGAALYKACAELGISKRTYNRWKKTDSDYIDKRTVCETGASKQDDGGGEERDTGCVQFGRVFIKSAK